jgi:hypothetical protein
MSPSFDSLIKTKGEATERRDTSPVFIFCWVLAPHAILAPKAAHFPPFLHIVPLFIFLFPFFIFCTFHWMDGVLERS